MDYENYDDLIESEAFDAEDLDYEDDYEDFDEDYDEAEDEMDELFEALLADEDELDEEVEEIGDLDDDYDERKRRRRRRRRRPRIIRRRPRKRSCCIHPKVKSALAKNHRKNRQQDRRISAADRRSRKNYKVNRVQNRGIGKLNKQMKLDGALDFADALTTTDNGIEINLAQVLKGAIKTGMFGDPKGALGNPAVIGGLGVLLNNPEVLGGLFGPRE